jgi:hypothetical protein
VYVQRAFVAATPIAGLLSLFGASGASWTIKATGIMSCIG